MGFLASAVGQVPAAGYDWYITLLEDGWSDRLRRELGDNFEQLARESGPRALVVRGFDRDRFSGDVVAAYNLQPRPQLPALIVSDLSPSIALQHRKRVRAARTIVLPLVSRGDSASGMVADVLRPLVEALRSDDAVKALTELNREELARWWSWLKYLELKPSFCGFGLNLNALIDDTVLRRK
jgi:hypothetical protein